MESADTTGPESILAILAGAWILAAVLLLVFFGACGMIAWIVAPDDRRWTFFWLTFLLFGPLGILGAAVASPRDPAYYVIDPPRASGRERFYCARCGARSDLASLSGSSCWQCGETKFVALT